MSLAAWRDRAKWCGTAWPPELFVAGGSRAARPCRRALCPPSPHRSAQQSRMVAFCAWGRRLSDAGGTATLPHPSVAGLAPRAPTRAPAKPDARSCGAAAPRRLFRKNSGWPSPVECRLRFSKSGYSSSSSPSSGGNPLPRRARVKAVMASYMARTSGCKALRWA